MTNHASNMPFVVTADENNYAKYEASLMSQVSVAMACAMAYVAFQSDDSCGGRQGGTSTIKRECRDMEEYIALMNPTSFHYKYHMDKDSFWMLVDMLSPHLPSTEEEMEKGAVPNGLITHAFCLNISWGGSTGSEVHGINDDEPLRSVWHVVDAIHQCPELNIVFPETYAQQAKCANGFKSTSSINIDCCIGAIDGMLVCMNNPQLMTK
ncbi:hypothetical protein ACHAW6_001762 [Cyclotella cf. meneghiniana]